MNETVGSVTSDPFVYALLADRTWRVTMNGRRVGIRERSLANLYYEKRWWGPAAGQFGAAVLHDLQIQVGGTLWLRPVPPSPPGTIF